MEYPRVNQAPEWFVVEADALYTITNLDTGQSSSVTGTELSGGYDVALDALMPLRFTVKRQ